MIQDIGAGRYHNEYRPAVPKKDSRVLSYRKNEILLRKKEDGLSFLTFEETEKAQPKESGAYTYLFSIDGIGYYLIQDLLEEQFPEAEWMKISGLRQNGPGRPRLRG